MAVVVATGVTATGDREILGLDVGDSEDEVFWRGFLTALKERGLAGVRLVISDQHAGLVAALNRASKASPTNAAGSTSPATCSPWCPRHKRHGRRGVPDDLRPTRRRGGPRPWDQVRDQLTGSFPKIGPLMDEAKAEVLAFTAFPRAHWGKSGRPTRSNGSTRRSNAAPASSASSPTTPP